MSYATKPERRNWMSYLMDSLVNSGEMPSWEALQYLVTNLLGEAPNPHLHQTKSPMRLFNNYCIVFMDQLLKPPLAPQTSQLRP
jgi:hypothetical protein